MKKRKSAKTSKGKPTTRFSLNSGDGREGSGKGRRGGISNNTKRTIYVFLLFVGFLIGVFSLLRYPAQIQIDSKSTVHKQAVKDYLSSHEDVIDKSMVFIDENKLILKLRQDFPALEDFDVRKGYASGVIRVGFAPRKAVARWQTEGVQYYIDSSGTIFPQDQEKDKLPLIIDSLNVEAEPGDLIAPGEFIDKVVSLDNLLKEKEIKVKHYLAVVNPDEVRAQLTQPDISVWFDTGEDMEMQIENLTKILESRGDEYDIRSYIDLRIPGKAFYK